MFYQVPAVKVRHPYSRGKFFVLPASPQETGYPVNNLGRVMQANSSCIFQWLCLIY